MSEARKVPSPQSAYARFVQLTTRWGDNDVYGHVNNVVYYAWFDSAVNKLLVEEGGLDVAEGLAIGLCVESGCSYHAPVSYPEDVTVGIRVGKLGTSSVRYELGVFVARRPVAVAEGHFVHVFVDRETRRPTPIPEAILTVLRALVRAA